MLCFLRYYLECLARTVDVCNIKSSQTNSVLMLCIPINMKQIMFAWNFHLEVTHYAQRRTPPSAVLVDCVGAKERGKLLISHFERYQVYNTKDTQDIRDTEDIRDIKVNSSILPTISGASNLPGFLNLFGGSLLKRAFSKMRHIPNHVTGTHVKKMLFFTSEPKQVSLNF